MELQNTQGTDETFVENSRLYTILPETSDSRFSEVLTNAVQDDGEGNDASVLPIKERNLLFFDEKLPVYVVLRIKGSSEEELRDFLPRLELKLDVWAVNVAQVDPKDASQNTVPKPERELVFSEQLKEIENPFVVLNAGDRDSDESPEVLCIWKTETVLNRPRARLAAPALTFLASATVLRPKTSSSYSLDEECLPSFEPAPTNLFERLAELPDFKEAPPFLPASRLERVVPGTAPPGATRLRITHAPPKPFRIIQAVSTRIRYSRSNISPGQPVVTATLDFEVTPFIDLDVYLDHVKVESFRGKIESLTPLEMPLPCRPRDIITFLYRIRPPPNAGNVVQLLGTPVAPSTTSSTETVSISVLAAIAVSERCRAKVTMAWTTNIDFAKQLNPSFGPPSQSLQRLNRPNSLPMNSGSATGTPQHLSQPGTPRPSALTTAGIRISFSAPSTPILVGKPFTWHVLVVNSSQKPAKLALIPLPQVPRQLTHAQQYNRRHASTASTQSISKRYADSKSSTDIAPAIVDSNLLYAMQHQSLHSLRTDVLALTSELRIGPLAPGTCHECEIKLMALREGALKVEVVRVVDLVREAEEGMGGSGGVVDVRDLPDVLAVKEDDS